LLTIEANDYDPAVRALLRGLFAASGARYVGPHRLGDNVHIAVTGNRRSDGVRASKIEDAPFTERSVKVTLVANLGDWLDWVDTQPRLTDSGSHVPAFLKFGSTTGDGLDHFNPPIANPYDGVPHPCPRTYEAVMLMERGSGAMTRTLRSIHKTLSSQERGSPQSLSKLCSGLT
jgi:hypothetical protein